LTRGLFLIGESDTESFLKLNHIKGAKHAFAFRHAFSRGRATGDVQALDNFTDVSARGSSRLLDNSAVGGWTAVLTPFSVNDLRVQGAAPTRPGISGRMWKGSRRGKDNRIGQ
jgi:hypothetical protein